ncbi:hypothetical protein [Aliiglaciecola litoralis]
MAKPVTPTPNTVVANWPAQLNDANSTASLSNVMWHIKQGQYPGNANLHYSLAQSMMARVPQEQLDPMLSHYLQARLLQYQHRFAEAQDHLDRLLSISPRHINGLLLKANLHLVKNQIEQALDTCKQLVGVADLMLATACNLEAASYQPQKLQASYQVLSSLLKTRGLASNGKSSNDDIETQAWLKQIAADMAIRLDRIDEAETWISAENLAQQPLSYVVLWADIQQRLGNYNAILEQLGSIVEQSEFKDDSLLIRLAMAEKAHYKPQSSGKWQSLAQQRIQLRVARNDDFHAADIARYYLYVDLQPEQALFWARNNFAHAKLFDDKQLLEYAQSFLVQQEI